jgi:hypothetical protein
MDTVLQRYDGSEDPNVGAHIEQRYDEVPIGTTHNYFVALAGALAFGTGA